MDILILDKNKNELDLISVYQSVIWNCQYYGVNDFQLVVSASEKNMKLLQIGYYLVRDFDKVSDTEYHNVMMIEELKIDYDVDKGWILTVTGSGLKNILKKRIVWNQTNLVGNAEEAIRQVITDNIINPTITERKIDDFILADAVGLTDEIEAQLLGENISDWLVDTCTGYNYGWDIYIKDSKYIFMLYQGTDRTFNQEAVKPVVFSPEYDNLISASYSYNMKDYSNACLVGGEGEGVNQRTASVGTVSGLDRCESYIDGSSVTSNGEIITLSQYEKLLQDYGQSQLDITAQTKNFSGEIVPNNELYKINQDYFLGDVVQIKTDRGITATPRIIEIIYAEDASGYSVVPTFTEWEVEE